MTESAPTQVGSETDASRAIGALVALILGGLVVAAIALGQPFGPTSILERPDVLVAALAVMTAIGWRLGRVTAQTGWRRALAGGIAFGLILPPVTLFVGVIAGAADAVIRGAANPLTVLGPTIVWGLYGLFIFCIYGSLFTVPAGIIWALITRALSHVHIASPVGRSERPTTRFFVALMVIALVIGSAQAFAYAPSNSRCLDLPGGAPTDAAFSPSGDLLAVTLQTDPNEPGTVLLMRWPSGEVIDSWSAWVDQEVAVDPDGRVYWSAWQLGFSDSGDAGDGVFTAATGSAPSLFASGEERELNDLTWTTIGLRGTTPNSHELALIPLIGGEDMDIVRSLEEVGAFWSSADGTKTVTGPGYFGTTLKVTTPDGTKVVPISGDARSVALSADGTTIVEASWFNGTRLIDVESAGTRLILRGSQLFVALSERGDLAWANEEQFGHGRLCTSTLDQLK